MITSRAAIDPADISQLSQLCPPKTQYMCNLDRKQSTFFCRGKFMKKLADNQSSSRAKGSICYIKHYVHTTMEGVWPEIILMFNRSIYYVLYLHMRFYFKWAYVSSDIFITRT